MKRANSSAIVFGLASLLASCSEMNTATNTGNPGLDDPSVPEGGFKLVRSALERDDTPDLQDAQLASFGDSSRDFALSLYAEVKEGDGNLFVSPYSISTALGMLYAGTLGETKDEIASALRRVAESERWIVEGAAGVAVAGLAKSAARWRGRKVATVLCGRNIALAKFLAAIGSDQNCVR